jgi:hypothetical protein
MSLHRLRTSALPALTTLIGSGGLIIGIWSFISPESAARAFGGYMVRVLQATSASTKNTDSETSNLTYVYPHGIRNLGQGLSIIALTAYWQLSPPCRNSPLARTTAQRCLGIVILVGALTPVVDAWVNYRTAQPGEDGALERNAARVHVSRTGVWLAGGLWCLFG